MAIVGNYTPQQMRDLIIKFYPGSYTPGIFNNVILNWESRITHSDTGDISAAITALENGPYQDETYTYLKYCEQYIVGYGVYGVQILKGRCYYGGIRDLGASIDTFVKPVYSETKDLGVIIVRNFIVNLQAYLNIFQTDTSDLSAFIHGWQEACLGGIIARVFPEDLPAAMSGELPANLQAYLNTVEVGMSNLSAFIHGFQEANLSAYIRAMQITSLPASLTAVPPIDLPAYLKVWPMKYLSASIYGWDTLDLTSYIYSIQKGDLPAIIGGEPAKDLGTILRGWVREATKDLGTYIRGFAYEDLSAIIRSTYLKNLPAYLYSVAPVDIQASIYGWDQSDLLATLIGVYGDYDLRASIMSNNNYKNLIGILNPSIDTKIPFDLSAYIKGVGSGY